MTPAADSGSRSLVSVVTKDDPAQSLTRRGRRHCPAREAPGPQSLSLCGQVLQVQDASPLTGAALLLSQQMKATSSRNEGNTEQLFTLVRNGGRMAPGQISEHGGNRKGCGRQRTRKQPMSV